jgi:hypothetical protein
MKREQIIEFAKKHIYIEYKKAGFGTYQELGGLEEFADAILALPLNLPSDEEIMQKYPFFDEDIDLVSNLDNQEGAKWMKEEIIKRNK